MLTLTDYNILEKISITGSNLLYRAERSRDRQRVILKILENINSKTNEAARIRNEYDIAGSFSTKRIANYLQLETYNDRYIAVLQDVDGISLEKYLGSSTNSIGSFLKIAIGITEIIEQFYQKGIVHRNLCPAHLIINPQTLEVCLIDMALASRVSVANRTVEQQTFRNENLTYISPEQTGKIKAEIDIRSDLYALGVMLYELVTGEVPFRATDASALIECHLTKVPSAPHVNNPLVPDALSRIILKLLSKKAADRYQSPFGLKIDLQTCLDQLNNNGSIESFELGLYDYSDKLQTVKQFYGREKEMSVLQEAFDRVCNGAVETVFIEGYSGIGKSSLVHQLADSVRHRGGVFVDGKFNQLQKNVPYSAFIQAFKKFADFILAQQVDRITFWREQIFKAVGTNGRVITDVIPDLELLTGPQPPVPALEPNETQNRFHYVFMNFIKAICQKEHPFVVFFDDLQWCDIASLSLIKTITLDKELHSFLFLGAYRNNEIDANAVVLATMNNMQMEGCALQKILLSPLHRENVEKIISETLNFRVQRMHSFVDLVNAKSQGNPFFINAFLKCLHAENLLVFDIYQLEWSWDADKIDQLRFSDDMAELMTGRIQKLPRDTQELLKMAACLGFELNLPLLTAVLDQPREEMEKVLEAALDENIVLLNKGNYRFTHDRIQQAVYSLINEADRKSVHIRIGKTLLKNLDEEARNTYAFEIVDQLNAGADLMVHGEEREQLCRLNVAAGMKAKHSIAYRPFFEYIQTGIGLLDDQSWINSYDLSLQLYTEGAESAFLIGNNKVMHEYATVVLEKASNTLDKVKVYEILIKAYTAQQRLVEAVQTSLQVLQELNIRFPKDPGKVDVVMAKNKVRMALISKSIKDQVSIPVSKSPYVEAAIRILVIAGSSAIYFAMPKLFPLFACKAYSLMIKYGNTPFSGIVCASYGLIMIGDIRTIDTGYKMGKLATRLSEKFEAGSLKCQTSMVVNNFILHWREPLKSILEPLHKNYFNSLETGNTEFASFTAGLYCCNSFFCGRNLKELTAEILAFNETIGQLRQEIALNMQKILTQAVINLQEPQDNPSVLTGKFHDEAVMLPMYKKTKAESLLFHVSLFKLILSYLFENYDAAQTNAQEARARLYTVPGTSRITIFYFYDTLALLSIVTKYSLISQKGLMKIVYANLRRFRKFAQYAPANCSHKLLLLEAELLRVKGRLDKAAILYDAAIETAKKNEYPNDLALACELAGKFYQSQHREFIAQYYIMEAYKLYKQWGALAKVKDMEARYLYIFEKQRYESVLSGSKQLNEQKGASAIDFPAERSFRQLDLHSIMKAAAAISGEIQLDKLLKTLVRIAVENAGAQQGFLILKKDNVFFIEAEGFIDEEQQVILKSIPVKGNKLVSEAIVQFVYLTKENLVIDNAMQHPHFSMDPIIIDKGAKSLLCIPIIHQGDVIGMLYFENDLISNAFTQERIELLRLLSGQMAIALQNALNEQKKMNAFMERENLLKQINMHQQELLKTKLEIQEQTYHNISEELHDNIGQALTLIKLNINTIDLKTPEVAAEKLMGSKVLITKVIQDLRDLAKTLNTDFIDNVGLVNAIELQLQFLKRTGLFSTDLSVIGEVHKYEAQRELVIFRIVQELLNNVVKHAEATSIMILMEYQLTKLVITVTDNGKGFDLARQQSTENKGLGLRNIHNRIALIRGEISFASKVQAGTTAILQVVK